MTDNKFRLITRSDFDGLACGVLLKHLDLIDDVKFVHPKDMQDGIIEVTKNDITTNLPYIQEANLVFDHHLSEILRNTGNPENHIIDPDAPSAARVVWKYYGGHKAFPKSFDEMMEAVDRADSAQFTKDQVLNPKGWDLLNFLMDARTGLGRFRDFRISNYNLMMDLINYCKDHDIDSIMKLPDVVERTTLYHEQASLFKEQLKSCSIIHDDLVVLDLLNEEIIHAGNRFMIYALFPECNISIHLLWGKDKQNIVLATGKSIFDRASPVNVGELMLKYNGGGHIAAGTCQIQLDKAEEVLSEVIQEITSNTLMS